VSSGSLVLTVSPQTDAAVSARPIRQPRAARARCHLF